MSHLEPGRATASRVTMATLQERSYRNYAARTAVIDGDRSLTYAELGERVHRVASGLLAAGMSRGDRGVILLDNCPEYFAIDQALFLGGFVRVAISTRLHLREVVHILADCGATTIFTSPDWAERIAAERAGLPALKLLVADRPAAADVTLADLLAQGSPEPPSEWPRPEDPAALLYTSGTTGVPKGATLSHANWLAMVRNAMVELPVVTSADVVLHAAPLSHLSGYIGPVYVATGAAHLAVPKFSPETVLDLIRAHQVTVLPMVPTMLNLLLLAAESSPHEYPTLRTIVYAGSPIAPDRLIRARAVFGDVFVQFYGLSETPLPLSCLSAEDHTFDPDGSPPARLASAGRVSPFVELRIVARDGSEAGPGEVGEIVVRTDTTMIGYWGRPEATAQMIDADGWARTGDLGRLDSDGYLTIVDRLKDMVITGGYNVYPNEVEQAISTLAAVQEVAVIGVPDETWGEALLAFVVVRDAHQLTPEEVIGACTANLASYKKPRHVEFVAALPRTGSGKLRKRDLRERYWPADGRLV
ncbi:class I adenylate-forming enzyme family protein [Kribbella sp. CA-253562]|uniref:class I adenylate-forming enzyme family protein n=1 Tax=Kribbella sp. CA-253562 TaxID=3239942 RepID=UPI003D8B6B6B